MDYVRFGKTGMKVSKLCLGCMSYGDPQKWVHPWVLNEADSMPFYKRAVEAGINFFDTANVYSLGASEEILGHAIKTFAKRDEVVIATKVFNSMREEPNGKGLSRRAIMLEIDASLKRLGMDHVDLYQIHRYDYDTPIEETMEALHDVVKAGKARYIGASSMYTYQFVRANEVAKRNGWTPFISMQNHYNLLNREEEREMMRYCKEENIAVIPWSPLARGTLTRPWGETSKRKETDVFGKTLYPEATDRPIVDAVQALAKERIVPMAQIGLAWVLSKPFITAPIIGATKMPQLEDALGALSVKLSDAEVKRLEEAYVPHNVAGFV